MKTKFNDAFFKKLGKSRELEAALVDVGGAIEGAAVSSAPVLTGSYKGLFRVEVRRGAGRTVVRVVNDDPGALAIEARHGTLQRAGRSVTK
ncbi:hypothetical protein ACXR2W_00795 [Leucobacter sp. HY1908]